MITLISAIIVGLIAGFLARAIVPGNDSMGIVPTIILGLVGSFVGGYLARLIGDNNGVGIIGSVIGAIVVLLVYRAVTSRTHSA